MSSYITVTGLGPDVTESQVKDFFSFCGKVSSVSITPAESGTNSAKVVFERSAAVKTALLLTDSEIGGSKVNIEASNHDDNHTDDGDDAAEDGDIKQEYKPRATILAEYLSHGYVLGDKVISRGLELDSNHGISSRFTSFITGLDEKYHIKDKTEATDKAYGISDNLQKGQSKITKYFDSALNTGTGSKVRDFYSGIVKNASDVHAEARRLADIKKKEQENHSSASGNGESSSTTESAPSYAAVADSGN